MNIITFNMKYKLMIITVNFKIIYILKIITLNVNFGFLSYDNNN